MTRTRFIVKTKTGWFNTSPIWIEEIDIMTDSWLYDISKVVARRTHIPRCLHVYYEGETRVDFRTFRKRENNPSEINLWLYVKGASWKGSNNVYTRLGIRQDFTVYFKSPTQDRQFENVKFDLSISSTVADLKEAIKSKHKWLKASWQTLVRGEINGKYRKVQDEDFLMNFHFWPKLIHEIEYYCFVKEKHWKQNSNFLHFPEISIHCPQTGFRCFIASGERLLLTLDDLKTEINERYGVPKKLQTFRMPIVASRNMLRKTFMKEERMVNQSLIQYYFQHRVCFE